MVIHIRTALNELSLMKQNIVNRMIVDPNLAFFLYQFSERFSGVFIVDENSHWHRWYFKMAEICQSIGSFAICTAVVISLPSHEHTPHFDISMRNRKSSFLYSQTKTSTHAYLQLYRQYHRV